MDSLVKKTLGNTDSLNESMYKIIHAIQLIADDCDDETVAKNLEVELWLVPKIRRFLVEIGFVSTMPRLYVGYDEMLDVGKETKEVYIMLKHMLLASLHERAEIRKRMKNVDVSDRDGIKEMIRLEKAEKACNDSLHKVLDQVQRYQAFMLKSQERYHNVKVFREFQSIVLEEVGKFDDAAKFEILGKMKDLIARKF